MFDSITSTIVNNKLASAFSFFLFMTVLFTAPLLLFSVLEESNKKITIKPEINFSNSALECLNLTDALTVQIVKPTLNQEFKTENEIEYAANSNFKCESLLAKNSTKTYTHKWYLDNNPEFFAETALGNLGKLTEGEHTLKYLLNLNIEGLKEISAETEIKFTVTKPVVVVPPIFNPPPPPPNGLPVGIIRLPLNGATYTADQWDNSENTYAAVNFSGSGSDPEDGILADGSLEWFYDSGNGKVSVGSGRNATASLYADWCTNVPYVITLRVTDSKGAISESTVNVTVYGQCIF